MKYKIVGGNFPAVICRLEKEEYIHSEKGAMSWMDPSIQMQTKAGGIGKIFGRILTVEKMFKNRFIAKEAGEIAFSSSFPGVIKDIRIDKNHQIIAQKKSFLASSERVDMSVYFQKRILGGLFGGEGFLLQKFYGDGVVFIEIDGSCIEYNLEPGQKKIINTGYLVAMEHTCTLDIEMVRGLKNIILGGEGFFNTTITGPGRVYLQTMPIKKTAMTIYRYIPHPKQN